MNKKGFSLLEVIIALGLLTIITFGAASILKKTKQSEDRNINSLYKNIEMKNILNFLDIKNIDWRGYNPAESLYDESNVARKVSWSLNVGGSSYSLTDIAIPVSNGNKIFNRSSHTIEKLEVSSFNRMVIFSRCLPNKIAASSLNETTAYNLDYVPNISWKNGNVKVYCCLKNNLTCTTDQIKNEKSLYSLKTFIYRKNKLEYFPKDNDLLLRGVGFIQYFNKAYNPNSYQISSVFLFDACKVNARDRSSGCADQYKIESRKQSGTVIGVQDRGYLQVR